MQSANLVHNFEWANHRDSTPGKHPEEHQSSLALTSICLMESTRVRITTQEHQLLSISNKPTPSKVRNWEWSMELTSTPSKLLAISKISSWILKWWEWTKEGWRVRKSTNANSMIFSYYNATSSKCKERISRSMTEKSFISSFTFPPKWSVASITSWKASMNASSSRTVILKQKKQKDRHAETN